MTDLWPQDLGAAPTSTPLTILKEQASLLGAKMNNIIIASVKRHVLHPSFVSRNVAPAKSATIAEEPFRYSFDLEAPALDSYTYRLFTVAFDEDFYPVRFVVDVDIASELGTDGEDVVASDEEAFKHVLSGILASQKTRKVINAIRAQSY
jgi:hypothetical protein